MSVEADRDGVHPTQGGRAARPEAAVLPSRESNLLNCHRRRRYDWSRALSRMRRLHHVCIIVTRRLTMERSTNVGQIHVDEKPVEMICGRLQARSGIMDRLGNSRFLVS